MIYLQLILSLFFPVALGYAVLRIISRGALLWWPAKLALAYGVGLGFLSQWMLLLGALRIPYSANVINLPVIFAAVLLFLYSLRRFPPPAFSLRKIMPRRDILPTPLEAGLLFVILWHVLYAFWTSHHMPLMGWDTLSTATFSAKTFYFDGSLKFLGNLPHPTYPQHLPFLQAWLAFNAGVWSDQLVKGILPFYFLASLLLLYFFLRTFTKRIWAFLGVVLLASSNLFTFHATDCYRDMVLAFYNCGAVFMLILWYREKKDSWLWLAAFFSAFMIFTKTEGLGYVAVHYVVLGMILFYQRPLCFREKFKKVLIFAFPGLLVVAFFYGWQYIAIIRQFPHIRQSGDDLNYYRMAANFSLERLGQVGRVFAAIINELFFSGDWNISWFFLSISIFLKNNDSFRFARNILAAAILLFLGINLFIYSFTQVNIWDAYNSALSRTILHFFPFVPPLIVLFLCPPEETKNQP